MTVAEVGDRVAVTTGAGNGDRNHSSRSQYSMRNNASQVHHHRTHRPVEICTDLCTASDGGEAGGRNAGEECRGGLKGMRV